MDKKFIFTTVSIVVILILVVSLWIVYFVQHQEIKFANEIGITELFADDIKEIEITTSSDKKIKITDEEAIEYIKNDLLNSTYIKGKNKISESNIQVKFIYKNMNKTININNDFITINNCCYKTNSNLYNYFVNKYIEKA